MIDPTRVAPSWLAHGKQLYGCGCRCETCHQAAQDAYRSRVDRRAATDPEFARAIRRRNQPHGGLSLETNAHQRARHRILKAIKRGQIQRPTICPRCGLNPGVNHAGNSLMYARIHDLERPLESVEWRCSFCKGKDNRQYPDPQEQNHA